MTEREVVYVVCAEEGEYSGRSDWRVCAFRTETDAKAHAAACEALALELQLMAKAAKGIWVTVDAAMADRIERTDPGLRTTSVGNEVMVNVWRRPEYSVEEVEIR